MGAGGKAQPPATNKIMENIGRLANQFMPDD